jgi:hypothetical protein
MQEKEGEKGALSTPTSGEDVTLLNQGSGQGLAVALDGLDVRLESRGCHFLELGGHRSDLVLVRSTLQHGEHLLTTE